MMEIVNSVKARLNGKRLLVLGGSLWKEAIQQVAKAYGITVIATGNDQTAGIFDIAQEKYNVDSTDINAMKKLILECRIDGVYMGGSEAVISAACVYLNELNMPCYCTKQQWEFLQNKDNFKKLCIKHGLPVVKKYDLDDTVVESSIDFPVIAKPTDGCGSAGFSVCKNLEELVIGYQKAKEISPTGNVIVEKFVNNSGIVVFYTVSNGKIFFSGLEDKYPVCFEKWGSYVGGLFIFESSLTSKFRTEFEDKIAELVTDTGIKEGTFWIEIFHDNGCFYFNEAGFRYGGSASIYPIDYMKGINQVAADIYFSLTGESKIKDFVSMIPETAPRKKYYAIYPIYAKPSVIEKILGVAELNGMNQMITFILKKRQNEIVSDTGTFSQVIALAHFVFDNKSEIEKIVNRIHKLFHVIDKNGIEMTEFLLDVTNIQF